MSKNIKGTDLYCVKCGVQDVCYDASDCGGDYHCGHTVICCTCNYEFSLPCWEPGE